MVEESSGNFAQLGGSPSLSNGRLSEQHNERIFSSSQNRDHHQHHQHTYHQHQEQLSHHQQLQQQHSARDELLYTSLNNLNDNWIGPLRAMIAQNPLEISLICVIIIIYLVYYFSQISRVS